MTKTYISYSRRHKEIATEISRGLQEFGHGVQTEFEAPTPGIPRHSQLQSLLRSSDAIIYFVSEYSVRFQYVISEIGAAQSHVSRRG
jgi:ubiquinone biosynthesis protein COQ9